MKKILFLFLLINIVILFISCDVFHSHEYGEWIVLTEANCIEKGKMVRYCKCGEKQTEIINTNQNHIYDKDGICTICKKVNNYTNEVFYDLSEDGSYAIVVDYWGTDTKVIISESYKGVPVTEIGDSAFSNNDVITSIVIPNSVITIGTSAFASCKNLTSIVLPQSVSIIKELSFAFCSNLSTIVIPDSVTTIEYGALLGCNNLTAIHVENNNHHYKSINGDLYTKDGKTLLQYAMGKIDNIFYVPDHVTTIDVAAFSTSYNLELIIIPDSVTSIKNGAFLNCNKLDVVIIGDGVSYIGYNAFNNCESLEYVVIGNGVTFIDKSVFSNCINLKDVFYTGSEEQWAEISIGSENSYLTSATKHYNYVPEN